MQKIKREIIDLVPVGSFLVYFNPVYGHKCLEGEHDDCLTYGCIDYGQEYIAEIDSNIIKITESNYIKLPYDVTNSSIQNVEKLWEDDAHDLRARVFKTEKEAKEHIDYTLNRFNNPQPWECFIRIR